MIFGDSRISQFFWSKHRVDPNGCWTYTGPRIDWDGRAVVNLGKVKGKKRVGYNYRKTSDIVHGPLPKGMTRSHVCPGGENKLCANPAHILYEDTHANTARYWANTPEGPYGKANSPEYHKRYRAANPRNKGVTSSRTQP